MGFPRALRQPTEPGHSSLACHAVSHSGQTFKPAVRQRLVRPRLSLTWPWPLSAPVRPCPPLSAPVRPCPLPAASAFRRRTGRPFVLVIDSVDRLAKDEESRPALGALLEYARCAGGFAECAEYAGWAVGCCGPGVWEGLPGGLECAAGRHVGVLGAMNVCKTHVCVNRWARH
jgi:hypothetical protein